MNMDKRHLSLRALLGLALLAVGCGQVLDSAPPDPAVDAGRADSGGGMSDAGTVDGAARDAGTVDGSALDGGTVDAGCSSDAECANGRVCDGVERCVAGACVAGEALACDDGIDCTTDGCSEADRGCKYVPTDGLCTGGSETNPEICSPADGGCTMATRCASDATCPASSCTGVWGCLAGICRVASVPTIPTTECITTACDPDDPRADAQGWVVTRDASVCDDGASCTLDRCATGGACEHFARDADCGDGIGCTADRCAPAELGAEDGTGCVFAPDATVCDDGAACTDNLCAPGLASNPSGCVYPPIEGFCGDGADCTRDACNPTSPRREADGCVFAPDDAMCPSRADGSCIVPVCSPATALDVSGCGESWTPRFCPYASRTCDESGMCTNTALPDSCARDADCDDGNPCNGLEVCAGFVGVLSCHRSTNSCPPAMEICQLAVCDWTTGAPQCALRPDPACYSSSGAGGP